MLTTVGFSIGRNARHATKLRQVRGDFDALTAAVLGTTDCVEKDGPYVCGPLRDGRRNKESALPLAWLALDMDAIAGELDLLRIVEAGERWRGFGYTTHSHNPEAGVFKARLFFAADREITPAEYPRVCAAVAVGLDRLAGAPVVHDASCAKPEQPLYTARRGALVWRFDGDPVRVDQALLSVPDAPQAAAAGLEHIKTTDPVLRALRDQGRILRDMGAGKFAIRCPFSAEHSREPTTDDTSTVYLMPHTGGFARGHFVCQHAHCAKRTDDAFHAALGLKDGRAPEDEPAHEPEADAREVPSAPPGSEIALARAFAQHERGRLRWSPGLDWMANRGEFWSRDEDLRRFSAAKALCTGAARRTKNSAVRVKLASAKTVGAVLALARDEAEIVTPADAWDRHPMLLNTPGGVYNLETGLRQERGDLLFTQITGAAPDASMRTPTWLRFVTEIFSTDLAMVEFLQRWFGYSLTGDRREHKLLFWHGPGANGKSVALSVAQWAMGSYALNLPADVLMRQAHQQHPTELAQLRGKRLALSSELEDNAYWAESRIKSLTGDATLTARFMRQDFFEFPQTQKHIIAGNFKPRLKGDDPAIARRMVLVPFLERFTGARCDPLLPERLRAELPGILAWFIEGARKWARDGLAIPDKVRAASAEYLAANDDISLWLDDCCALGPDLRTPSAQLYRSYVRWKEAAGERPQSSTAWGARIGQRFDTYRTKHERGYVGVAVLDSAQQSMGFAGESA